MSGSASTRKAGAATGTAKRAPSITANINIPPAQSLLTPTATKPSVSAKPPKMNSESAQSHLEMQGVLNKETRVTFNFITDALISTAENTDLSEEVLRTQVVALAHVGQKYINNFIITQALEQVLERFGSIRKEQEEKSEQQLEEVRKGFEAEKATWAKNMENAANAKEEGLLAKFTTELKSLKETIFGWRGENEKKAIEAMENISKTTNNIQETILKLQPALPAHGLPSSGWGQIATPHVPAASDLTNWGNYGYESNTHPRTYAEVAHPGQNSNHSNDQPSLRQEGELNRLRASEEKRDRQILLDADNANNGEELMNISADQLKEKVDEAIRALTADDYLQEEELLIVKCKKVTKQPKGGVLLLMNSTSAQTFLTQPDTYQRFVTALSLPVRFTPRTFRVVLEKVPIEAGVSNPVFPRQIERDNGLQEGEVVSIKWIKNPACRTQQQRHAHALIELRSKFVANNFIRDPKMINGTVVFGSKYITDSSHCFKCQQFGHGQLECPAPRATCGTCGGDHRMNTCSGFRRLHCSTCAEDGHATWDRTNCPKFFCTNNTNNAQSLQAIDRGYKYYITKDNWTWELASKLQRPTLPSTTMQSVPIVEKPRQGTYKRGWAHRRHSTTTPPASSTAPHSRRGSVSSHGSISTPQLR